MLFLVGSLCAAYVVIVFSLRRAVRGATREATRELPQLPADDRPPAAAVGRPPEGAGFTPYVDEGFDALDAYLSQGLAP